MRDENSLISIVMPVYNEGERIYRNLIETAAQLERFCPSFMIIAVNDGSSDESKQEIERAAAADARIRVISYERVTAEDGSQMDVARITIDGQEAAIVDVDLDGWADGMVADYNQDGNISEDEIVSFQGGDRIEMAPLAQAVNYEGDTGGFVDGGEPIDIIDVDGGDEFDGGDDDGEPIDNVEPDWNDDDILPAIDDEDLLTASNTDDGAMPDYVNNGDVSDMGSDDMLLV